MILISVKYLQNVAFSFEKGSNSQNPAQPPDKKILPAKFDIPP